MLRRIVLSLAVLALALGGFGFFAVRRSFPNVDGRVSVGALAAEATVTRDANGIPQISATTSRDLFVAQGYVHAQDRFWQMDTWRHIGAGRLSEMFGESQVETDAFLRTLGFSAIAQQEYELAPAHVKEALDAYADGVNAYLAERGGGLSLSLEYGILGLQNGSYTPEPWTPQDSLTWAHVMAWDLRANLDEEINRAVLATTLGVERTEQLYPPFPADHAPIVGDAGSADSGTPGPQALVALESLDEVRARLDAVEATLGRPFEGIGSNNWVVDGSRTASGSPLLANDPHLGIQMPSIWYINGLWCEDVSPECPYRVSGFSFPGAPGVVIGHNERIAWGVTNEAPDTMDLFIERTDGADRYEADGDWVPFDVRTETIRVAGGADTEITIRSTRHGPIISGRFGALDSFDDYGVDMPDDYEVALRWQALEPSTLFEALLGLNVASNWEEFRSAAALFDIAPQNLVYADVDGHIGYQSTGEIPVRANGDGRYPVPGWTSEYEWTGLIDFDDLPRLYDPPSGIIVTANQPVVAADHDDFIGIDHAYGYRSQRILDLLEASSELEPAAMVAIQHDTRDGSAPFVVPAILDLSSTEPGVTEIQGLLAPWREDGYRMEADSAAAAAYASVWRHLLTYTFDDELPAEFPASGGSRYFEVVRHLIADPGDPWWDDIATAGAETANDILTDAVVDAHRELSEALGNDPSGWRWGDLHTADFENQTLGQSGIGPIERLFNRRSAPEVSGGSSIVNATSWYPPDGYGAIAVPSMRMVVDLAAFENSLVINTTGQSGHAFHRHYFDMNEAWATGGTKPLAFGPEAITEPHGVLVLAPAG